MNQPNLFIIGAPKCGTTSLASWLDQHPQIWFSKPKEPHYFSDDVYRETRISFADYSAIFHGRRESILGEASTRYLFSDKAVPNIERTFPESKYIVLLRNPVDMVRSLHNHLVWLGVERIVNFDEAWDVRRNQSYAELRAERVNDPDSLKYSEIALFGEQVSRLFSRVDRNRVAVIALDDLRADPFSVLRHLVDFIGVDARFHFLCKVENKARTNRSALVSQVIRFLADCKKSAIPNVPSMGLLRRISRLNLQEIDLPPLESEKRKEIQLFFKSDIVKLEAVLGRELSNWYEY
jgi:hypothetical protein